LRWASADAAAIRAAFETDLDLNVFPADDAARAPVRSEFPTWARSDAAARFAAFEAVFDESVRPAAEAARLLVCLERAISIL
jgi:hypothetical protein